jgi:hypothetical protein
MYFTKYEFSSFNKTLEQFKMTLENLIYITCPINYKKLLSKTKQENMDR